MGRISMRVRKAQAIRTPQRDEIKMRSVKTLVS